MQINIVGHIAQPLDREKTSLFVKMETELIFILSSSLPQWLPVISKKICKWVLCLGQYGSNNDNSILISLGGYFEDYLNNIPQPESVEEFDFHPLPY